ncbi:MAG: MATE family efflux transporter [candidate division Zixibacteria bacterium]|nr:MATE family efflux transporter [candidate division Zixibacteria bacterium]
MSDSRPLTSGPMYRAIISLAWPIAAAMFMEFALAITDFFWIGRLGAQEQDAMTSCLIVVWTIFSLLQMITIGVNAIVARNYGADNIPRAGYVGGQGVKLALLSGLVFGALGMLSSEWILNFMDAGPQVIKFGVSYLSVFFLATPLFFVTETLGAVFRASGNTRIPMIVSVFGVGLNIILDPILIFGWGPVPAMGIAGAAWGTVLSLGADLALYGFFLGRGKLSCSLSDIRKLTLDLKTNLSLLKIGVPMTVHYLVFVGVYAVVIQVVHKFGYVAGAAMGIGNRMEAITFLGATALALAASAIVGQNLGANKPERAARSAWITVGMGVVLGAAASALFFIFPSQLAGIFTQDAAVVEVARGYLIILGLSQSFMAIEIILEGCFSGAGNTVPPMVISIPGSLIRIPMAYYLAIELGLGIDGVWWTFSISTAAKAALMAYWFSRNGWKNKSVE